MNVTLSARVIDYCYAQPVDFQCGKMRTSFSEGGCICNAYLLVWLTFKGKQHLKLTEIVKKNQHNLHNKEKYKMWSKNFARMEDQRGGWRKIGRFRWQWDEREGSVEGGECVGIQRKSLANLSALPHCPILKASASILRPAGQGFPAR